MKKITSYTPNLTTLSGIIENYNINPGYYENKNCPWYMTRFEPLWGTMSYTDNTTRDLSAIYAKHPDWTEEQRENLRNIKGWEIKCAIIDVVKETGQRDSYDTIWFDMKGRGDKTIVICQIGKGKIRFEIEGNIPKLLKGKEQPYKRD